MEKSTLSSPRNPRSAGFTLIELMIVIAIVGILATIAAPQYETYTKRTRFAEVILATTPFKRSAEIVIQTGRATTLNELDAGQWGIPDEITTGNAVGAFVDSVDMEDGVITAVGSPEVDNAVFQLSVNLDPVNGTVSWSENSAVTNSCQRKGIC